MLRVPNKAIAAGLAVACFFSLASCDPVTAPSRFEIVSTSQSLSFTRDAPELATLVVGTGNPTVDVAAVQAAVEQGGHVILEGYFSFAATPSRSIATSLVTAASSLPPMAEVLISKTVDISGASDEQHVMTTIEGGTIPFYIDAPGQRVTIRGLRFVHATSSAILVHAANGLAIVRNDIVGVVPFAHQSNGISITTIGGLPNPVSPGSPELIAGALRIERNEIDMAGGSSGVDNTLGLTVFSVGVPGAEVDARISGNRIRNVTEPAVNVRRIVGRATIEHNDIRTGSLTGTVPRNSAIRIANTGSYLVAHNSITCEWAATDAQAIGAFSQFAAWPVEHAMIEDNLIHMRAPAGTAFTAFSAGIGIYGFAVGNTVRQNSIDGAALAAVAIPSVFPLPPQAAATQQDNSFIRNGVVGFTPADADVFVGTHAARTRIVRSGTVDDQGTGTIVNNHFGGDIS